MPRLDKRFSEGHNPDIQNKKTRQNKVGGKSVYYSANPMPMR